MIDLPASTHSATCACRGKPFKANNNQVYAWRSMRGVYRSEFCADEEEDRFQDRRRA
jgi:hypothetical protein